MNKNLEKSIVELLTTKAPSSDIAQLLMQNGVEISDEDYEKISAEVAVSDEFEELPYELSEDKTSFAVETGTHKMSKELKKSFVKIPSKEEARFLQDIYYQTQNRRIALQGQIRSINQGKDSKSTSKNNNEGNMEFLTWYLGEVSMMEDNVKKALEAFSDSYYISRWAKKVVGIGPVISTVLAANLEIKDETMHAGNWWSYCGLNDNNRPWLGREKSKVIIEQCIADNGGVLDDHAVYAIAAKTQWKMSWLESKAKTKKGWSKEGLIKACSFVPYNKALKVLMYKIGHSFRLCVRKSDSLYGRILKEREEYENKKNETLAYKDQAAAILASKNIGKTTVAYEYYSQGKLPPAHIHQRAERYATKLFISHLFEAAWYNKYGTQCPEPYIIGFDENGHNDYIAPEVPYDSVERDHQ